MGLIEQAAKRNFEFVTARTARTDYEYFLDHRFMVEQWVDVVWTRGEWFLDEYFRGLAQFGNSIFLIERSDNQFSYWCEGAKYRPKKLDNADWCFIKDHVEAMANMASNAIDGGLGMVTEGPFQKISIFNVWDTDTFDPDIIVNWANTAKEVFKGWKDLGRLRPVYKFDGWGLEAWVEKETT